MQTQRKVDTKIRLNLNILKQRYCVHGIRMYGIR